jgi:hypothetical protein
MQRMWMMVAGMVATPALASPYYLESEASSERSGVYEAARVAADAGVEGSILRLYVRDQGWVYVYRSNPTPERAPLEAVLATVAERSTRPIHLVEMQGEVAQRVATAEPGQEVDFTKPVTGPATEESYEVQDVLRRISRAHAGESPSETIDAAGSLVVKFERLLADRRVAHVYARRGEDRYLETSILEGPGVGVRLGILRGQPWVAAPEGAVVDAARVREQIERFSPDRIMQVPLWFTGALSAAEPFDRFAVAPTVRDGAATWLPLVARGGRDGRVEVRVDPSTWRIGEVIRGEGDQAVRWLFDEYVSLPDGRIYPQHVEVYQAGRRIDEVRVQSMETSGSLPDEWFPRRG